MEKLDFTKKDPGPPPPSTNCKRCGQEAKPKFIFIGWRQQEHCELCSKIVAEEREREIAIRERKEKIVRLFEASGMRGIMRDMTFDSFNSQRRGKIYEAAKQYAEDFTPQTNTGLILFGKAGTGKTHLAVAIARYVIEQKQIAARVA
ncbi:ATP-binding protein, partial [Candidatus Roizmanbacteria bacterium]|nr:ATP-binding protein [Candidatus Roizmanbacteria bacterium]